LNIKESVGQLIFCEKNKVFLTNAKWLKMDWGVKMGWMKKGGGEACEVRHFCDV
jgi:hypothetical protein